MNSPDTHFAKIKGDITAFRAEVRGDFAIVKWMLAATLAMEIAIFFKVFSP